MKIVSTFSEARAAARGRVALVPTMGFFHEGHLSLIERAATAGDTLMVSLYVNPLQFEDPSDLSRYPRDPDRDAELAEQLGTDILFMPDGEAMFPEPPRTRVVVAELTESMEGAYRPGHFEGVATVVTKLFAGLRPDVAFFGRKDAQQLSVVRRLVGDFSLPVEIVGCPIIREHDGLALSSRNVFLTAGAREEGLALSRGLRAAAEAVIAGERDGTVLESKVTTTAPAVHFEYVTLAARDDCAPLPRLDRPGFLAAAARVDGIRLIDNVYLEPDGTVDTGIRLEHESILYQAVS